MNVNKSQFFEDMVKIGPSVDEKGEDPQGMNRPRVQYTDLAELGQKDVPWTFCLNTEGFPQVMGNKGKKFDKGKSGPGCTPSNSLTGTIFAAIRGGSDNQTHFALGSLPTMGGESQGGGQDQSQMTMPGTGGQDGEIFPIKSTKTKA